MTDPVGMATYLFGNVMTGTALGLGTVVANGLMGPFFGPILASNVAGVLLGGDVGKTLSIIGTTEAIASVMGGSGMVQ